jgi:RHS repeat-associated protein
VVQDRLGSVVARGNVKRDYFPYGDEIGGATAGNVDKFGTYMRDQTTGLDYADQRYYAGSMSGRFLTADPSGDNWRSQEPKSWNMYSYVDGDPINFVDPNGLATCGELEITAGYFAGRTVDDVMQGTSGGDLMAQTIYHEGGTIYDSDLSSQSRYLLDLIGIGTAILNQWDVDNGRLQVYDRTGARTFPMGGSSPQNRSLEEVIISIARDGRGALFSSTGQMRQPDRAALNKVLQTSIEAAPLILDSTGYWINRSCQGVLASINVASGLLLGGLNDRYKPNGLVLLFWNLASADSETTFPGSAGYIGVEKIRQQGHTFWGLRGGPPPAGRGADVGIPRPGRRGSGH